MTDIFFSSTNIQRNTTRHSTEPAIGLPTSCSFAGVAKPARYLLWQKASEMQQHQEMQQCGLQLWQSLLLQLGFALRKDAVHVLAKERSYDPEDMSEYIKKCHKFGG
jgi:hypothetical protein